MTLDTLCRTESPLPAGNLVLVPLVGVVLCAAAAVAPRERDALFAVFAKPRQLG